MPKQPNLKLISEGFTYKREQTGGTNFGYFGSSGGNQYYLKFPSIHPIEPHPSSDNQFRSYCEVIAAKLVQQILSRSEEISSDIFVPESRLVRVQQDQLFKEYFFKQFVKII